MTDIKINRAKKLASIHGMPVTARAVMAALNTEVEALAGCTSKQLAAFMRIIQSQYHTGRASCGAEIIDGDAVWVAAGVDKLVPLDALRAMTIEHTVDFIPRAIPCTRDGSTTQRWDVTTYSMHHVE